MLALTRSGDVKNLNTLSRLWTQESKTQDQRPKTQDSKPVFQSVVCGLFGVGLQAVLF
jgi:hypothetical protein